MFKALFFSFTFSLIFTLLLSPRPYAEVVEQLHLTPVFDAVASFDPRN